MYVMVAGVVGSNLLKWVPRKRIATMVVDGLNCGTCKEPHALARAQSCHLERNAGTKNVEQEPLKGMVIQGAKGVRNIEAVMTGMDGG